MERRTEALAKLREAINHAWEAVRLLGTAERQASDPLQWAAKNLGRAYDELRSTLPADEKLRGN